MYAIRIDYSLNFALFRYNYLEVSHSKNYNPRLSIIERI